MNRAKFGKIFYNVCLIACVVVLLISFFIFKTTDSAGETLAEEELTLIWIYRYLISFYIFSFLIPLAGIVREVTSNPYDKKKMFIKIGVGLIVIVVGTSLIFISWTIKTVQLCMLGSMLSAVYILAPTIKNSPTNRTNEKKI
jgi:hypothetical protein